MNNESQENAFYWGVANNNTGNGAFNLLWDQVQWGGGESQTNPFSQIRWHDVEPYFGDTWKVARNVTLEYGIRWSFLREPYSGPDKIANFDPRFYNAALGSDPCNGLVLPPGANFCSQAGFSAGTPGQNRALKDQNNHAIAPRIGRGVGSQGRRQDVGSRGCRAILPARAAEQYPATGHQSSVLAGCQLFPRFRYSAGARYLSASGTPGSVKTLAATFPTLGSGI